MSLCSSVLREVRRVIADELGRLPAPDGTDARGRASDGTAARQRVLLDIGCWDGDATAEYATLLGARALGIEVFDTQTRLARERGIDVAQIDLEASPFPWPDGSVDVVVCNQVFEHLKNIWLPMAEIHRVLAPGGWLLLSVPNLSSFHNRVMLSLGLQPTSIRTLGPHVRGYAAREIRSFVAHGAAFRVVRTRGVGFYPLPAVAARPLARIWSDGAHTTLVVAQKQRSGASPWMEWVRAEQGAGLQTHFGE